VLTTNLYFSFFKVLTSYHLLFSSALAFIEGFVALNVEKALAEILALDKFATRGLNRQDYENPSLRQTAIETLIGM
jgi:hypothetical protein